jgi:site-specific DNA recombinase
MRVPNQPGTGPIRASTTGVVRGRPSRIVYRCMGGGVGSTGRHVSRDAGAVEEYVTGIVLGLLAEHHGELLAVDRTGEADAIAVELATVRARLDELALMFADGSFTRRQVAGASTVLYRRAEVLEEKLAQMHTGTALAALSWPRWSP